MVGAYRKPIVSANNNEGREGRGSVPPQQESLTVPFAGAYRGTRSDLDPAQRVYAGLGQSVAGGRGSINPPLVAPAISELKTAPKIVSGGGGDFGGGGASGAF